MRQITGFVPSELNLKIQYLIEYPLPILQSVCQPVSVNTMQIRLRVQPLTLQRTFHDEEQNITVHHSTDTIIFCVVS